jgi:hypothetical protein
MPDLVIPEVPLSYENRKLRSMELPATQFLVPDRIPYGLWLHSAPAGGYKSAFAAQIEHHIAYGTPIPGLEWQFAQHGDCLVISPDESAYEMQDRTFRILPGGQLETDGLDSYSDKCADIHVRHEPHGADFGQRMAWLLYEIEQIEQRTGRHIVWIRWDTIGNLLGDRGGVDHYTHAMPLQTLNRIMANSHRVMYMPNHLGKNGESIGSVNLTASSNLSTKAEITRGSNSGVVTCLEDGTKMRGGRGWSAALQMRDGLLILTDESPQEAGHQLGSLPRMVARFLAENGPSTVAQLRKAGIADRPLWKCILRLKARGEVYNDGGNWTLQETGSVSTWPADWRPCELCSSAVDPHRGCVNVRCARFTAAAWSTANPGEPPTVVDVARSVEWQEHVDSIVAKTWYKDSAPVVEVPTVVMTERPEPAERDEPCPTMSGNEYVDKLIELVKTSPLYAQRQLSEEIRAQLGYDRVCLGGSPNAYQMWPKERPEGRVLILDRKAAYFQSCATWHVPNLLHRQGNLDYGDIVRQNLAGMFEIVYTPWENDVLPDPLGTKYRKGTKLLVPRSTLDRVMDSVKAGDRREPELLHALVGKGSERGPLYHFGKWCLDQRRAVPRERLPAHKEQQNQAFGTMRIVDESKNRGPVDRPDWQYAAIGHHYATVNRYAWAALNAGDPLIATGNTDEMIFLIPDDQDAMMVEGRYEGWLPESMRKHLDKARFAVKDIRDAASWYQNPRSLGA